MTRTSYARAAAIAGLALSLFFPPKDADADSDSSQMWKSWPDNAPKCDESVLSQYFSSTTTITKYDALYHLSICSHTKVADILSFAYAVSQLGGTEEGAIRSLASFANVVAKRPDIWEKCIKSSGVSPRDDEGAWRSLGRLLPEFIQAGDKADPNCIAMLK